ncbi:hypothetical protein VTO42DRAFT_3720 [Malbranchea cinnamomea]
MNLVAQATPFLSYACFPRREMNPLPQVQTRRSWTTSGCWRIGSTQQHIGQFRATEGRNRRCGEAGDSEHCSSICWIRNQSQAEKDAQAKLTSLSTRFAPCLIDQMPLTAC